MILLFINREVRALPEMQSSTSSRSAKSSAKVSEEKSGPRKKHVSKNGVSRVSIKEAQKVFVARN